MYDFIIWKLVNKGKKSSSYFFFAVQTVSQSNKIVDDRKLFIIELFQLVSIGEIIEFKYHHFVNPNLKMGLGIDHQRLLIYQKEEQPEMSCLMMNVPNNTYRIVFPKWSNLNSTKPLALTINLWEIQGTEKHVKWCHRNSVIPNHLENSTIQMTQSLL